VQTWPVADAVARSSLPAEKKRELFLYAANHANLEHRRFGLSHLQKLDPRQFMTILLATLEDLPRAPPEAVLVLPGGEVRPPRPGDG
jgi:hypothetical protein